MSRKYCYDNTIHTIKTIFYCVCVNQKSYFEIGVVVSSFSDWITGTVNDMKEIYLSNSTLKENYIIVGRFYTQKFLKQTGTIQQSLHYSYCKIWYIISLFNVMWLKYNFHEIEYKISQKTNNSTKFAIHGSKNKLWMDTTMRWEFLKDALPYIWKMCVYKGWMRKSFNKLKFYSVYKSVDLLFYNYVCFKEFSQSTCTFLLLNDLGY